MVYEHESLSPRTITLAGVSLRLSQLQWGSRFCSHFSVKNCAISLSELPIEPLSDRQQGTSDRAADSESDQKPAKSVDKFQGEKFHRYPFYSPRFWHGMRIGPWYQLLRAGRFRIHPSRIGPLIGVSFAAPINSLLAGTQRVLFGRKLAAAEFHGPPVFIVGHWRSGTTLLHELMVRDDRLSSPSTFQCFVPSHFHVSEWFFRRFAWWLLPGKRPMDNMAAGFDHPQEDEFALLVLGMPSPYRRIAFPNQGPVDLDYLDFDGVPQEDVDRWLAALRQFLLSVSSATGRPLVVKSPTHTGRIGQLAPSSRKPNSSTSPGIRANCFLRPADCGTALMRCKRCRNPTARRSLST